MKTEKISINKTAEKPDGIEVEIVQPERPLEDKLLSFLLTSFLRELKRDNRIPYDLPQQFTVEHVGNGTFVARAFAQTTGLYEPPRPIAILGIRHVNGRFDLIHAAPQQKQPQTPAAALAEAPPAEQK